MAIACFVVSYQYASYQKAAVQQKQEFMPIKLSLTMFKCDGGPLSLLPASFYAFVPFFGAVVPHQYFHGMDSRTGTKTEFHRCLLGL